MKTETSSADTAESQRAPAIAGLAIGQKIGFGSADFGFNLYYTGLNIFLLYYYTDILGIRPAIAGLIFALPLFWDALTDPVMGAIASRTRSRFGSYRPYLLYGALPLAVSFVMMFVAPILFPSAIVLAAALSHIVFRTCYTIVSIPYTAMSARLTDDSGERGTLAGVRIIFAALGGVFTVMLTLPLAGQFGGQDPRLGFAIVAMIYAVIASLIFLVTFSVTRERMDLQPLRRPSLGASFGAFRQNHALHLLIGAVAIGGIGSAIFGKALVYYVIYVAGLDLDVTLALIVLTLSVTLAVPVWMIAAGRLSKRNVWLTGAGLSAISQCVLFLFPPETPASFLALIVLIGFGNAAFATTFWSMLPDTVEYGQFRSGVRDEGLVFGLNQLSLKAASGLGIGLLGFLLEAVGYRANEIQTPETIAGLRQISILLPLGCTVLAAALICFYPLDRQRHARLVRALRWRGRHEPRT